MPTHPLVTADPRSSPSRTISPRSVVDEGPRGARRGAGSTGAELDFGQSLREASLSGRTSNIRAVPADAPVLQAEAQAREPDDVSEDDAADSDGSEAPEGGEERPKTDRPELDGRHPFTIHALNTLLLSGAAQRPTVEFASKALRGSAGAGAESPPETPPGTDDSPETPRVAAGASARPHAAGSGSSPLAGLEGVQSRDLHEQARASDAPPQAQPHTSTLTGEAHDSQPPQQAGARPDLLAASTAGVLSPEPVQSSQSQTERDGVEAKARPISQEISAAGARGQGFQGGQSGGARERGLGTAEQAARQNESSETGEADRVEAQFSRGLTAALTKSEASEEGGEVRLLLKPEALGPLRVRVTLRQGVVNARFETSSPEARGLLDESLPRLRASLEARGLSVERFEVHSLPGDAQDARGAHAETDQGNRPSAEPGSRGGEGTSPPGVRPELGTQADGRGQDHPQRSGGGLSAEPLAQNVSQAFEGVALELPGVYSGIGGRLGIDALA